MKSIRGMKYCFPVLLVWAVGYSLTALGGDLPEPPIKENAAIHYWHAATLIQQAHTPEDIDLIRFVDRELPRLPPMAFSMKPEAGRWLLDERPMITVLDHAAQKKRSVFPMSIDHLPNLDLGHLAMLQDLSQRALAAAKAYEYAENTPGAAVIYRDLLYMVEHIDQDANITSGLIATEILQSVVVALEGFLSREPPQEAVGVLTEYFRKKRRPVFHVASYLQNEAERFGSWLLENPQNSEARLESLYGDSPQKYAVDRLLTLSRDEKAKRLKRWVIDYETRMFELAEASEKPFRLSLNQIRQWDEEKAKLQNADLPLGSNPLIPLLVPTMEPVYGRFLLAESQFSMISILSYAALYRAELGHWPVNLDTLSEMMRKPMPRDSFSGDAYFYKLVKLRPRIVTRVPKWISKEPRLVHSIDVTRRRTREKDYLKGLTKKHQKELAQRKDEIVKELQKEFKNAPSQPALERRTRSDQLNQRIY